MIKSLLITLSFTFLFTTTNSARILGILHVPTPSHYFLGEAVLKGLADKGHDVTIASPFKSKEKNINFKEVFLDGLQEIADEHRGGFFSEPETSTIYSILIHYSAFTNKLTDTAMRSPAMQKLLKSGEKYDILMVEPFGNDAFFGLAHIFHSHLVIISTGKSSWVNHYTGNVAPYSFVPNLMTPFSDRMSFIERAVNSFASLIIYFIYNRILVWPVQKKLYEEMFEDVPPFEETSQNVSLVLVNTHVVFETPRPYVPNMIPIGGVHVKEPKKLPEDLQTYLDNATEGAIFFSLGSNLLSSNLPPDKQQEILRVFSKFPQKVLWKYENENLPNKPDNVIISKWFPQGDILAHPNTKLFITHGGLLSSIETLFRGVPIIGIPVYGDQYGNIANLVSFGYGQSISLQDLNEESFTEVIKEVLHNPRYRNNVQKTMKILQDQPEKPLDRAVFWVEHVLRHNGARYLRSASVVMPWYQYLLLDILGAIALIFIIFILSIYVILRKVYNCCFTKCVKEETVKTKKE